MKLISSLLLTITFSVPVISSTDTEQDYLQTGRYSYLKNTPVIDQLNPLKVVVTTSFPQSVESVGEAVEFLLIRSGYELADRSVLSREVKTLLGLPLPQVHRSIGPITLDRALSTLGGSAYELVVDPIHRKVAFELTEHLAGF